MGSEIGANDVLSNKLEFSIFCYTNESLQQQLIGGPELKI